MRNVFSLMFLPLIAATIFILNMGSAKPISAQTCLNNPPQDIIDYSYPQNSVVNVYIEPTFTQSQANSIRFQLELWSNQGLANVSFNEVFDVGNLGDPFIPGARPTMQFSRGLPSPPTAQAGGSLTTFNGCLAEALITINQGVTNETAFAEVVSHEIGHEFALNDCISCSSGTSAMTYSASRDLNALGGILDHLLVILQI